MSNNYILTSYGRVLCSFQYANGGSLPRSCGLTKQKDRVPLGALGKGSGRPPLVADGSRLEGAAVEAARGGVTASMRHPQFDCSGLEKIPEGLARRVVVKAKAGMYQKTKEYRKCDRPIKDSSRKLRRRGTACRTP